MRRRLTRQIDADLRAAREWLADSVPGSPRRELIIERINRLLDERLEVTGDNSGSARYAPK